MPRRRKSMHNNKAPLIFTESPVNKQSHVPSPVYCARHPLTAKSVPVEDLQNLTWVSPQFQNDIGSSRKVKKQRKRRSTSGPKCTCHCGNSSNGKPIQNTKFKPLEFIGDKTPPITILEDVSFSDEEDVENISQQSVSPCLNRLQTSPFRKLRHSRSNRKIDISPKNKHKSDKDLSKSKHLNDFDETDDNFNIRNMSVHTPVTNIIMRDQERASSSAESPVNKVNSPVKRLFTSVCSSPETNVFTLIKNRSSAKKNRKVNNRLMKNLNCTVCSPSLSNSYEKILVADTPDADYGIPNRLRRLRNRRKKQHI